MLTEVNAKIVNQRFKEIEAELIDQKETITRLQNHIGNMQNLIQAQTEMIQKVWLSKKGTGGTENGRSEA